MPSDKIAFFRQANGAFFFQYAQGGDGIGHDRRLRIFGQCQIAFRAFAHQTEQMLAQGFIDLFKHRARDWAGFGECLAHANGLAALSGENECAHI